MQNSCDLVITNASAVIPKVGIIADTNIMVEDGKIKAFATSADNISTSRKINARGKYVLPGAIDPHVHYGVYTPINEAARSESRSAAVGGITTMIRMLRLYDGYRNNNITNQLLASKGNHYVDYSIHASILRPDQVKDIPYLKELGISSLKIYMNLGADLRRIHMDLEPSSHGIRDEQVDMTDELMSSIVNEASRMHSTILVHAENPVICSEHIRKAKEKNRTSSLKQWSDCRPPSSEAQSIAKDSELGRKIAGPNLYFVH